MESFLLIHTDQLLGFSLSPSVSLSLQSLSQSEDLSQMVGLLSFSLVTTPTILPRIANRRQASSKLGVASAKQL